MRRLVVSSLLVAVAAAILSAQGLTFPSDPASSAAGTWRRLPQAPVRAFPLVSVWTGRQMLIFGRAQPSPPWSVDVAAAYDPAARRWRRLTPLAGPRGNYEGRYWAVWTGREMLVQGPSDLQAYAPAVNRWRRLPAKAAVPGGIVAWTGRELIGWGGGCCGDASAEGAAYDPATNTRRALARSPLAPEQRPIGAWTGRELIVLVHGVNPATGRPYPAKLARAATYDPRTDTWRRIAPLPATRHGANAVWDGRELLVVGGRGPGGTAAATGFAYDPATDRWHTLARAPTGRVGAAAIWTGRRLLLWGGTTSGESAARLVTPSRGLRYDPRADRWATLPPAPVPGRFEPAAVWTGRAMIVVGGYVLNAPPASGTRVFSDGAAFTPAVP